MRVTLAVSTAFSLTSRPKKLFGRDAGGEADFGELAFVLGEEPQEEALLEFAQGAVGDEEEVAGAAGGVEDAELAQLA